MKKIAAALLCLALAASAGCTSGFDEKKSSSPLYVKDDAPDSAQPAEETPPPPSVPDAYKKTTRRYKEGALTRVRTEVYDERGNLTSVVDVNPDTGEQTASTTYSYVYDENGNVIEKYERGYIYTKTVYELGANGEALTESVSNAATGQLLSSVVNSYDEKGNLIKSVSADADGAETELENCAYVYGENGLPASKTEFFADGAEKASETFAYDEQGRLIGSERLDKGEGLVAKKVFKYEYDDAGRETFAGETDYDADGNVTAESNILTAYDENGRELSRENFLNGSPNWSDASEYEIYGG